MLFWENVVADSLLESMTFLTLLGSWLVQGPGMISILFISGFLKYFSLIQNISYNTAFPSFTPPITPITYIPKIYCSSICLQRIAGFPGTLNKHAIKRWNNNRHIHSQQGYMRLSSKRKRNQREGKRVRDTKTHSVRSPTKSKSQTTKHIFRGSRIDPCRLCDYQFSVSP